MIDTSKVDVNKKGFCVAPWLSLNINQNGDIQPCCASTLVFGNIIKDDIETIWNNDTIKEFRLSMLEGEFHESCRPCYEKELARQKSLRQVFNETLFNNGLQYIYDTNEDGSVVEPGFIHWDVKFGNKCNFKCRSCGPSASSSIELELYGKVSGLHDISKLTFHKIKPYIEKVDHLYFSGGEPLIIDEHYKMLRDLIKLNKHKDPKFSLTYNTNFSVLKYKKINVFDLWDLFGDVQVRISVDGAGKRGELLRHGFKWKTFLMNVKAFNDRFKNKKETHQLYFDCTVQALNIFDVVTLHKFLFNNGLMHSIDHFHLNYLHGPRNIAVWILDEKTKERAKKHIKDHIDNFLIPNKATHTINEFSGLIKYIDLYDDQHLIPDFMKKIKYFDNLRGEDTISTFPELIQTYNKKGGV